MDFSFRADSSLDLTWEDAGGGTAYELQLNGAADKGCTQPMLPFLSPGSLPAGELQLESSLGKC